MANKKSEGSMPVKDQTLWYSDLNFMPPQDKNSLWMAQQIFYLHLNGAQFLDPKRYKAYSDIQRMKINKQPYIDLIDPKTPMGGGGTASYFASDFQTVPVDTHIENIVRAKMAAIGTDNKLQVSEIDKYAKTQKQREYDRIIHQDLVRNIINYSLRQIGLPAISDTQDPYKWVKSLDKTDKKSSEVIDTIDNHLDYIRSQIRDSQDLALYNEYVYKGDIERAFEMGIDHYLINLNKWRIQAEWFNNDLKNFNRTAGLWYVDEQSGRGVVKYIPGYKLWTLPFIEKNGEDCQGWRIEEDITFAEFVRRFGDGMREDQLKEVFELNKTSGAQHGMSWGGRNTVKGSNAMIRIGFMSVLTQDAERFSVSLSNGKLPLLQQKPLSWLPQKGEKYEYKADKEDRIYNVWYSCYYVPPPGNRLGNNNTADWAWQSQYVFNIRKEIDMYRYGVDMRYAKSALVVWKDDSRPSFTDIKEEFMPKIRTTWHKFQNCLVNDIDSVAIAQEFMGAVLNATDEQNKINPGMDDQPSGGNGMDPAVETFKMIKQGGIAMLKMTDRNGNMIVDPSKFVIPVKNNAAEKAEKYLKLIIDQYNLMRLALAQSDQVDPKPRTNEQSILASIQEEKDGLFFLMQPCREFLIMYGERCVQHIINMVRERKKFGYKRRWEEFENVVGLANALMIEGIEKIQPEDIGLTVSLEDVAGKQQYYISLTTQMAKDGDISQEDVQMIINSIEKNYKYGACLLNIASKKKMREKQAIAQEEHNRAMELKQMDLQIALALNQSKAEGKNSNIATQGAIDKQLQDDLISGKTASQAMLKDQTTQGRMQEATHKANLENEKPIERQLAQVTE